MNKSEKILLSNNEVLCSEYNEDISALNAKFIICSFDTNGNNIKINRKTIDNWLHTLVNQPVVGKITVTDNGTADFTSHNMHLVTKLDSDGETYQDYEFDSEACGVFTSAQIEKIKGKEYITANAKIWKRFSQFCNVVKKRLLSGTLKTSWEISTLKSHIELENGKKIKVIDDGCFLGHSLLGSYIPPAYPESQLLEVASCNEQEDAELIEALNNDIIEISNINKKKEDNSLEKNINSTNPELENSTQENQEEQIESTTLTENSENNIVETNNTSNVAALTDHDIRKNLRETIADKLNIDTWDFYIVYNFPTDGVVWVQLYNADSELDIIKFSYTVENDIINLSEPENAKLSVSVSQIDKTVAELKDKISEQANALIKANENINCLNTTIAELNTYKDKFEQAEQEKIQAELKVKVDNLKNYALNSKLISEKEIEEDETIKNCIANLEEDKIKLIIAERFMAKQEQDEKIIETSSKSQTYNQNPIIKANLESDEEVPDYRKMMDNFLNN